MRPKIKMVPTGIDKVLDSCGTALLAALWLMTIYAFVKMPDIIPVHFNGNGKVDDYGNKVTILLLPAIATVMFLGLTWINKYPHIFNYPTEITEANAERQYRLATRMLRFVKLAMVLVFTEITVSTYLITAGVMKALGAWILPVEFSIIAVPVIVVLVQSGRREAA